MSEEDKVISNEKINSTEEVDEATGNFRDETVKSINVEGFIKRLESDNYEININSMNLKDPAELLEKLLVVKNQDSLNSEDKIKQVQKIVNEYME